MKSDSLKCRKNIENINPRVSKTSNGRAMVLSSFVKNQEAKGLLSDLGIRTPLCKVLILGDIFF